MSRINGLVLDWSPLRLVQRTAQIDRLQADHLDFSRLPESREQILWQWVVHPAGAGRSASPSHRPGGALARRSRGWRRRWRSRVRPPCQRSPTGTIHLDAARLDSPGHYAVSGRVTSDAIEATVKADEPANGLISGIAHLPDLGAIAIQASVNGPRDSLATQVGITAGAADGFRHRHRRSATRGSRPGGQSPGPRHGARPWRVLAVGPGGRQGARSVSQARRQRHDQDRQPSRRRCPDRRAGRRRRWQRRSDRSARHGPRPTRTWPANPTCSPPIRSP